MVRAALLASLVAALGAPAPARADASRPPDPASGASCLRALDALGVEYKRARRRGVDVAVEVRGRLGGVEYRSYASRVGAGRGKGRAREARENRGSTRPSPAAPTVDDPLIIDCSLAFSLARAGELLRAHDIDRVTYSSAYQRRNIRGTSRPSRHSFGLAIDVHTFVLRGGERLAAVKLDYEQGLGEEADCMGEPLTELGALLRAVDCQVTRSGLFRIVLTPDYDGDHYNHFHLEALPWRERSDRDPSARLDAAWTALDRGPPAGGG